MTMFVEPPVLLNAEVDRFGTGALSATKPRSPSFCQKKAGDAVPLFGTFERLTETELPATDMSASDFPRRRLTPFFETTVRSASLIVVLFLPGRSIAPVVCEPMAAIPAS